MAQFLEGSVPSPISGGLSLCPLMKFMAIAFDDKRLTHRLAILFFCAENKIDTIT